MAMRTQLQLTIYGCINGFVLQVEKGITSPVPV